MAELLMYAKRYKVETYILQKTTEQCFHLTSMDAEAVAVRLLLTLHRKKYMPESYYIACIYVKKHQTHIFGPRRKKTCLRRVTNNTGVDQSAHPRSLISAFVFRCLESITSKLATNEISTF